MFGLFVVDASAAAIPDLVVRAAQSFAQLHPDEKRPAADVVQLEEYGRWFFQGFTHPSGQIFTQSDLMRDAYVKGQTYWREHPLEREAVFAGYGYAPVDVQGVWTWGFEKSAFQAPNSGGASWWMDTLGGVGWRQVGLDDPRTPTMQVHLAGYLSPKGHYGHMGAYEQEIIVTAGAFVEKQ